MSCHARLNGLHPRLLDQCKRCLKVAASKWRVAAVKDAALWQCKAVMKSLLDCWKECDLFFELLASSPAATAPAKASMMLANGGLASSLREA
jgi:hypothetical protein